MPFTKLSRNLYCEKLKPEAKIRLFCFPSAGSSHKEFTGWATNEQFSQNSIEIFTVKLHKNADQLLAINKTAKRVKAVENFEYSPPTSPLPANSRTSTNEQHKETKSETIDNKEDKCIFKLMVMDMVDQITPYCVEKAAIFFGHSAGGLFAYECIKELERRRLPCPMLLFVSSQQPPTSSDISIPSLPLPANWTTNIDFIKSLLQFYGAASTEQLLEKDDNNEAQSDEQLALFAAPFVFQLSVVDYYCKNFNSLYDITEGESSNFQVSSSIIALGASGDKAVPCDTLSQWQAWSTVGDEYSLHIFDGDHFYFEQEEQFNKLVALICSKTSTIKDRLLKEANEKVSKWNSKKMDYPSNSCLHDLFAQQAKLTPQAVALCDFTDNSLTFKELDDITDKLAYWLYTTATVRPDSVVGIYMERCIEYVIAYIAILKAGGAYMPIEVVYPPELIERVLKEAKPAAILTKHKFCQRLPSWQLALSIDGFKPNLPNDKAVAWRKMLNEANVPALPQNHVKPTPDNLAYVVMSSGTTGIPKGICCPHRGAVHSYYWRHVNYPFERDEKVACNVFFVWEVLRPLLKGIASYVIPDDVIYDPSQLLDFLEKHQITRILFTPSLLQLILDTILPQKNGLSTLKKQLRFLKVIWLCGEVVTVELRDKVLQVLDKNSDLALLNKRDTPKFATCGPVMENVELYVLDDELNIVPISMAGEIYVGGPCLARGYLNMPELTATRFVKSPFSEGKLYKTGDKGRMLPNGSLEVIGRCDYMVKIRGYSIVLGAVEVAIAEHPKVSTCVVLVDGEEGTDKRLVAYVVPESWANQPTIAEIQQFIKSKLPKYAVPALFIALEKLPLHAASGKLDRKKLPPPSTGAQHVETVSLESLFPDQPTYKQMVDIWAELLPSGSLDVTCDAEMLGQNFFDVGGHSLLAIRLLAAVKTQLHVDIPLAELLNNATFEHLMQLIEHRTNSSTETTTGSTDSSSNVSNTINLESEAQLPKEIYPAATRKVGFSRMRIGYSFKVPSTILLTGATGFLGSFILDELLRTTKAKVYCLVRAEDTEAGYIRIKRTLRTLRTGAGTTLTSEEKKRLTIVAGNIQAPLLGLPESEFFSLARTIDSIIHCAAEVNLVKPYNALKAANVLGTQEILRLAVTNASSESTETKHSLKSVHYISTNSVFPFSKKLCLETDDLHEQDEEGVKLHNKLSDGYSQSKWVAENLCIEARRRGIPISVNRAGNLSGSSTTGLCNSNDFIQLLLHACILLRVFPNDVDWKFDLTPVDWAARVIVLLVHNPSSSLGQTFHIQSPHQHITAKTMMSFLQKATDTELKGVPFTDWRATLSNFKSDGDSDCILKLQAAIDNFVVYLQDPPVFDTTALQKVMDDSFPKCPVITESIINKYVEFKL